jgi:hypothetical protein
VTDSFDRERRGNGTGFYHGAAEAAPFQKGSKLKRAAN